MNINIPKEDEHLNEITVSGTLHALALAEEAIDEKKVGVVLGWL